VEGSIFGKSLKFSLHKFQYLIKRQKGVSWNNCYFFISYNTICISIKLRRLYIVISIGNLFWMHVFVQSLYAYASKKVHWTCMSLERFRTCIFPRLLWWVHVCGSQESFYILYKTCWTPAVIFWHAALVKNDSCYVNTKVTRIMLLAAGSGQNTDLISGSTGLLVVSGMAIINQLQKLQVH